MLNDFYRESIKFNNLHVVLKSLSKAMWLPEMEMLSRTYMRQ